MNAKGVTGKRRLVVAARVTLRIDVEAWNAEYGTNDKPSDIRVQAQAMAADAVVQAFAHLPVDVMLGIER